MNEITSTNTVNLSKEEKNKVLEIILIYVNENAYHFKSMLNLSIVCKHGIKIFKKLIPNIEIILNPPKFVDSIFSRVDGKTDVINMIKNENSKLMNNNFNNDFNYNNKIEKMKNVNRNIHLIIANHSNSVRKMKINKFCEKNKIKKMNSKIRILINKYILLQINKITKNILPDKIFLGTEFFNNDNYHQLLNDNFLSNTYQNFKNNLMKYNDRFLRNVVASVRFNNINPNLELMSKIKSISKKKNNFSDLNSILDKIKYNIEEEMTDSIDMDDDDGNMIHNEKYKNGINDLNYKKNIYNNNVFNCRMMVIDPFLDFIALSKIGGKIQVRKKNSTIMSKNLSMLDSLNPIINSDNLEDKKESSSTLNLVSQSVDVSSIVQNILNFSLLNSNTNTFIEFKNFNMIQFLIHQNVSSLNQNINRSLKNICLKYVKTFNIYENLSLKFSKAILSHSNCLTVSEKKLDSDENEKLEKKFGKDNNTNNNWLKDKLLFKIGNEISKFNVVEVNYGSMNEISSAYTCFENILKYASNNINSKFFFNNKSTNNTIHLNMLPFFQLNRNHINSDVNQKLPTFKILNDNKMINEKSSTKTTNYSFLNINDKKINDSNSSSCDKYITIYKRLNNTKLKAIENLKKMTENLNEKNNKQKEDFESITIYSYFKYLIDEATKDQLISLKQNDDFDNHLNGIYIRKTLNRKMRKISNIKGHNFNKNENRHQNKEALFHSYEINHINKINLLLPNNHVKLFNNMNQLVINQILKPLYLLLVDQWNLFIDHNLNYLFSTSFFINEQQIIKNSNTIQNQVIDLSKFDENNIEKKNTKKNDSSEEYENNNGSIKRRRRFSVENENDSDESSCSDMEEEEELFNLEQNYHKSENFYEDLIYDNNNNNGFHYQHNSEKYPNIKEIEKLIKHFTTIKFGKCDYVNKMNQHLTALEQMCEQIETLIDEKINMQMQDENSYHIYEEIISKLHTLLSNDNLTELSSLMNYDNLIFKLIHLNLENFKKSVSNLNKKMKQLYKDIINESQININENMRHSEQKQHLQSDEGYSYRRSMNKSYNKFKKLLKENGDDSIKNFKKIVKNSNVDCLSKKNYIESKKNLELVVNTMNRIILITFYEKKYKNQINKIAGNNNNLLSEISENKNLKKNEKLNFNNLKKTIPHFFSLFNTQNHLSIESDIQKITNSIKYDPLLNSLTIRNNNWNNFCEIMNTKIDSKHNIELTELQHNYNKGFQNTNSKKVKKLKNKIEIEQITTLTLLSIFQNALKPKVNKIDNHLTQSKQFFKSLDTSFVLTQKDEYLNNRNVKKNILSTHKKIKENRKINLVDENNRDEESNILTQLFNSGNNETQKTNQSNLVDRHQQQNFESYHNNNKLLDLNKIVESLMNNTIDGQNKANDHSDVKKVNASKIKKDSFTTIDKKINEDIENFSVVQHIDNNNTIHINSSISKHFINSNVIKDLNINVSDLIFTMVEINHLNLYSIK
jgi:hypothetical protein